MRNFVRTSSLMGILGVFLAGCTAAKKPSRVETALANAAKDVAIPIQAEGSANPLPDSPAVIEQGRQVYMQNCALCHSMDGRGTAAIGMHMYPPAMDLNSPHVQHWSDADLYWIIQNGVRLTGMPSWETEISANDTWALAHFIHNLPRLNAEAAASAKAPPASQVSMVQQIRYGRTLYRQEGCFMCHRLGTEGGRVGPDLTAEGKRGRSDQWLIGHFKDPQKYSPGSIMPAFKNLTDAQLQALTTFLQNQKGK